MVNLYFIVLVECYERHYVNVAITSFDVTSETKGKMTSQTLLKETWQLVLLCLLVLTKAEDLANLYKNCYFLWIICVQIFFKYVTISPFYGWISWWLLWNWQTGGSWRKWRVCSGGPRTETPVKEILMQVNPELGIWIHYSSYISHKEH